MANKGFFRWLKRNKEGIIIGGVIGYFFGKLFMPDMVDLQSIMSTQGLVDVVLSTGKQGVELAKTKIVYASTFIGAVIGGYLDSQIPEGWWRKKL